MPVRSQCVFGDFVVPIYLLLVMLVLLRRPDIEVGNAERDKGWERQLRFLVAAYGLRAKSLPESHILGKSSGKQK